MNTIWYQPSSYLVLFQTVLKYVLYNQTACLAQRNLVPHATQGLIDILHDLRRRLSPTQLKQFLPDMTSVAVNNRLGNPSQQLMDHDRLVVFRDRVECLLHDMAAKRIHRQIERVSANGLGDLDDLLSSAMLKAALHQEVAKTVDHQRVGLGNDGLDNVVLLLGSPYLELLLQKDGSLLVIVADNLVNNILPVTRDITVKQTTVVEGLGGGRHIGLTVRSQSLISQVSDGLRKAYSIIALTSPFHDELIDVNSVA